MKRTLFLKIFAGCFIIIFVLTALILLFSFRAIRDHHTQVLRNGLIHLGLTLELKTTPYLKDGRFEELDNLVKDLGKQIQTRITIISPAGVVLADSEKNPKSMEKHRTRPEIIQALKGKVGTSIRFSTTVQEEMLYVALPLRQDGENLGVLRMSLFLKDTNILLNKLKVNITHIVVVVLAFSLLATALFARSLSKPIRELRTASGRVASGDFDARVFLKSRDELKELADSFNYMTDKLKTSFTELARQKEELNSIISSLEEGLLVLDSEGMVVLSNESFKRIVGDQTADGRFYWEVIREPQFGELIKNVTEKRSNILEEVTLAGKIFLCSATFVESREGVVVVLHDITQMKDLDKIKRDFVVNVSHELRTPLTAIKGFTETLEGVDERNQRYLDIIRRHTDRLINIVNDLLLLSGLEERGFALELEEVNVKELVENILRMFEPRLKEKNLVVKLNVDEKLGTIQADPFRLEQLFINLVDNAIKYTEKGEIVITLTQKEARVSVEIRDTGIGIPEEHLPRIFERFYVADKSRSKGLSSTGLGLSIVKHIVLLHNGKIEVDSTTGMGTTFTISLPASSG
jgi:two-component system phosphate regulon sensor histidine kinase PhoR